MSRDRFVFTNGQIRTLMTFTRTCKNTFVALTLFGLVANDGLAAEVDQDTTQSSPPSLAGDQLKFNEGIAAYDAGEFNTAYAIWLPLAKAGDLGAMRNVGHMLRRGVGVEQNLERALWFYERAARAGLASAALNAGMLRIKPDSSYYDLQKGVEWLDLAAMGGSPDAMWELAKLIAREDATEENELAALALIKQAAALGHEEARQRLAAPPETQVPLSVPSVQGVSDVSGPQSDLPPITPSINPAPVLTPVPPEAATPVNAALVSPEQGALFMKGVYLFDDGEFEAAGDIWRPLADEGVVEAQYRLGRLYRFGLGVTPDVETARKWLSAAASQGHEKAAETLSILPTR